MADTWWWGGGGTCVQEEKANNTKAYGSLGTTEAPQAVGQYLSLSSQQTQICTQLRN